ncbi:MAG: hypothetical protein N838_14290 [Thiohalocapsa sp. PB-PSB1]|nr:MAG: hypothetical protein N838_12100 [Thiohalocapsa sp. PB-PSB1]QQO54335.1 MAG: hypothetical protein N838_14290 [Thiohalocapsa sp. PB-PSB1]
MYQAKRIHQCGGETRPSPAATRPPPKSFRGYLLAPVYLAITNAERAEVMAMWRESGAFRDPSVAESRRSNIAL